MGGYDTDHMAQILSSYLFSTCILRIHAAMNKLASPRSPRRIISVSDVCITRKGEGMGKSCIWDPKTSLQKQVTGRELITSIRYFSYINDRSVLMQWSSTTVSQSNIIKSIPKCCGC
jgi:hypothetical protein